MRFSFRAPDGLARYLAPKGSVALNGTSLTVNEVEGASFGVNLIPHTLAVTTWGAAEAGDLVNLEIDTLARYVARLTRVRRAHDRRDRAQPRAGDGRRRRLAAALLERRARRAPAAPAARGDPPQGPPRQGDRPRLPHLRAGARDLRARHHRLSLLLERARHPAPGRRPARRPRPAPARGRELRPHAAGAPPARRRGPGGGARGRGRHRLRRSGPGAAVRRALGRAQGRGAGGARRPAGGRASC